MQGCNTSLLFQKLYRRLNQNYGSLHQPTVEYTISKYFANLHAQLQALESKLHKDAAAAKNINFTTLSDLGVSLDHNISKLNNLILAARRAVAPDSTMKANLSLVAEKLENAISLPCHLVGEAREVGNIEYVI